MSDRARHRDELVDSWLQIRDIVIAQVRALTEDDLAWTAGDGARTGLAIARHVADCGVRFADDIAASGAISPPAHEGEASKDDSAAEVLAELLRGREHLLSTLGQMPPEALDDDVSGPGQSRLRRTVLAFAYAHEMYHAGQLSLCARAAGKVPTLTSLLAAAPAAPA